MNTVVPSSQPPFGSISIHNATGIVERAIVAYTAWRANRRTAEALSELPDYLLDDIGVDRPVGRVRDAHVMI